MSQSPKDNDDRSSQGGKPHDKPNSSPSSTSGSKKSDPKIPSTHSVNHTVGTASTTLGRVVSSSGLAKTVSHTKLGQAASPRVSFTGRPKPPRKPSQPLYRPPGCDQDENGQAPDFIYGGPFIHVVKPSMFMDIATPINIPFQGTFKGSLAYDCLKDRLPTILTKVIDSCSKSGDKQGFVQHVAKLKSDLITNKDYCKFEGDSTEAKLWNDWIQSLDQPKYFFNSWVWTECYVYRKLREGCELNPALKNFDYFEAQKVQAFSGNLEPMCVVAEKMMQEFLEVKEDKAKKKEEFMVLLKVSLWANRVDFSQSVGETPSMQEVAPLPVLPFPKGKPKPPKKGKPIPVAPPLTNLGYFDPFQVTLDLKFNLLTDDSGKAFDTLWGKAEKTRGAIAKYKVAAEAGPIEKFKFRCSCHRLAVLAGKPIEEDPKDAPPPDPAAPAPAAPAPAPAPAAPANPDDAPPPRIPCPAKMTVPQYVFFDVVCDNSGYELFADICVAHYLVAQEIVEKVRFHVKKIPWFVSDVTINDFNYLINQCKSASFSKTSTPPEVKEGEEPIPVRTITAAALNQLGQKWSAYLADGTFQVMDEDFWTYPHVYKDMKKYDLFLYRKLQYAAMILFKGDLNYRKLVGERNCVPILGLEPNLQGFTPAPLVTARTIKSEAVCGLPKGRYEQLIEMDPKWMSKGNFGLIQQSKKAEAFPKVPDGPCQDYGITCFGKTCPVHTDQ